MLTAKEPVFTVAEVTRMIGNLFENTPALQGITVRGEISNFVAHRSGHLYFTLKDKDATIKCVMFRGKSMFIGFKPENGMEVDAAGKISIYGPQGTYQLYVEKLHQRGSGDLYRQFELLKKKLQDEGLFAADKKQAIPRFPKTIGVVSSLTAAALRDILNVLSRRHANLNIIISEAQMQGISAAPTVIRAIDRLERYGKIDVMLIARGGGSFEELSVFNDEEIARRVSACSVPIISGIGHETDFTIIDFVADLRAPTPSAAAELATTSYEETIQKVKQAASRLTRSAESVIAQNKRLVSLFSQDKMRLNAEKLMNSHIQRVDEFSDRMELLFSARISSLKAQIEKSTAALNLLHPENTMKRGFALVEKNGIRVQSAQELHAEDSVQLAFFDGSCDAVIQ